MFPGNNGAAVAPENPGFFFPEVVDAKKCYCHVNGKGKFVTQKFLGCNFRHSIIVFFFFFVSFWLGFS
jgi:hypothetical protein